MRPATTRVTFVEVVVKGVFQWRERPAGRVRQRTRKFVQTINPWNKSVSGQPKSHTEIMTELKAERDLWLLKCKNDLNDTGSAA